MPSLDFIEDGSSDNLAVESDTQLDSNLVQANLDSSTGVGGTRDTIEVSARQHWNSDSQKGLFAIGEETEEKVSLVCRYIKRKSVVRFQHYCD